MGTNELEDPNVATRIILKYYHESVKWNELE
jgi:hypothetical protein